MQGTVRQINVSDGGVPKRAVEQAEVRATGLSGDRQNNTRHHGGPLRAVCLFAWEVIERLQAEGHPIRPGGAGENLTLEGVDWERVTPGARVTFEGGVELEITSYTEPCATIRESFTDLQFRRIKQDLHPGESRVYARVLREGVIRRGEAFAVSPASDGDGAERTIDA